RGMRSGYIARAFAGWQVCGSYPSWLTRRASFQLAHLPATGWKPVVRGRLEARRPSQAGSLTSIRALRRPAAFSACVLAQSYRNKRGHFARVLFVLAAELFAQKFFLAADAHHRAEVVDDRCEDETEPVSAGQA